MEYFPAPQLVHVFASLAISVLEYFPATQLVHTDSPNLSEYVPAAQAVQAEPAEFEYVPFRHWSQDETSCDPVFGVHLPGPQSLHVASELPFFTPDHLPYAQSVHWDALPVENLPSTQS